MEDTRYPYTYSCDLIRDWAGYNQEGTKLSRSDASKIRHNIADIIGMDDKELAIKLADYYKVNENRLADQAANEFLSVMDGWER